MLVEKGRLALGRDVEAWIGAALAQPGVKLMPIEPAVAVESVRLPGYPAGDPADRLIIATARRAGVGLMTADRAILDYGSCGYLRTVDAGV